MAKNPSDLDPVKEIANEINQYLGTHPNAADNLEGVSNWWLSSQSSSDSNAVVKSVLQLLINQGEIEEVITGSGEVLYRRPKQEASSSDSVSAFLKPLELAHSADESQLVPEIRDQLRSIANHYLNNAGHKVLFTGASGTGKTLAARILGRNVGHDVYRVDLAAVISKYIGETEKNLSQLLESNSPLNTVLFFDEADSLFGKRSEVSSTNDRFANINTNFLIQRIEDFRGIVILSTNFRDNLDDAVLERVTWEIDFVNPATRQRTSLLQRILSWFRVFRSG